MARLDISRLTKFIGGNEVLRDIGFTVQAGELVSILGASGSGKTTLLRLIAGFEKPDGGEIRLGHEPLTARPPERRGIGYVAQEGALFPHLCVADNITFGLSRAQRRTRHRVAEMLSLVGLPAHYADRAPQALSGGEQQRVALARALAPNPRLLLLDEPFSALDAGLRLETRAAVARAIQAAGTTAILVTHDQEEALSLGSRVGVLQHGRLAQMSAPQELYHRPVNAYVADFVGEAVFCPGLAEGGRVHCALGALRLASTGLHGPVTAMIRPEQVKIVADATPGAVPAVLNELAFYGRDAVLSFSLQNALAGSVTARVFSQNLPPPGATVWLAVEGEIIAYPAPLTATEVEASMA